MKKPFNLRVPLLLALAIALGGLIGYLFAFYGINLLYFALIIPVFCIFIIVFAVKKHTSAAVISILTLLFIVSGTANTYARLESYKTPNFTANDSYRISGEVSTMNSAYENYVILNRAKLDGKRCDGKILVYIGDGSKYGISIGDEIYFEAELYVYDLFPYGKLNNRAEKNIRYYAFAHGDTEVCKGHNPFALLRGAAKNRLNSAADEGTAEIAYAMLFGETNEIEKSTLESLRYGGITHVFAVSGLHIGLIFGIMHFITKKLPVNKWIKELFVLLILFLYVATCGFTLSSLRAYIMCCVFTVAKLIHRKHDSLNALSVSVIIILLFSPLSLFFAGFLLSVSAVLGICLMSKKLSNALCGLPKGVATSVSVSLSAQLATAPVMLSYFGYLSGAGIGLNIIIVPIISAIFSVMFVLLIISLIMPFAAPAILPAATIPLKYIVRFFIDCGFEDTLISGFGSGLFTVIYFIILLLISDKLNMKNLTRFISVTVSIILAIIYVSAKTFSPVNGYEVIVTANNIGGTALIKNAEGCVLVLEKPMNSETVRKFLSNNYVSSPDAVVVLGEDEVSPDFDTISYLKEDRNFTKIGARFEFTENGNLLAYLNDSTVAVCKNPDDIQKCDLLISSSQNSTCECGVEAYFNLKGFEYNVYELGDLTFKVSNEVLPYGIYPRRP